jgi:1,4-alpha-glucan branching enzyme
MIKRSHERSNGGHRLTFVLQADQPAGKVSVVGDFNAWRPGAHLLRRRSNGTRSVSVTLPAGSTVCFRYLGENGLWFDDGDADLVTEHGSLIRL